LTCVLSIFRTLSSHHIHTITCVTSLCLPSRLKKHVTGYSLRLAYTSSTGGIPVQLTLIQTVGIPIVINQLIAVMKRVLSAGDIASSLIDHNSNDTSGPFTQAKGRRKKAKKGNSVTNSIVNDALQSSQSADLTQSTQAVSSPASSELSLLYSKVDQLLSTIHNQQETIRVLSNKLNFVLSFLNICDNTK